MRPVLWVSFAVLLAVFLIAAPNALWLSRSSAIVHNAGPQALILRLAYLDDPERIVEVGELPPGASRFLWLDPVGEATLAVHVRDGAGWREHCANYIEQGMYRVAVTARSATDVECGTDLPLFDRLLVLDYLS